MRTLLAALLVTLLPAASLASPEAEAKAEYSRGVAAFELGQFERAIASFEKAYELSRRTPLLWNVAQAHRRQFEVDKDIEHLRRARFCYGHFRTLLEAEPKKPGAAKSIADARREEESVKAQIAEVEAKQKAAQAERPRSDPQPAPAAAVAVAVEAAPAKATTPIYKKWWLWTAVAAVVVVGAGVGLGVAYALPNDATATSPNVLNVRF